MASLGCFENTDFTWQELSGNLESKGEDINNIDNLLEGRDIYIYEKVSSTSMDMKTEWIKFSSVLSV